MKLRIKESKVRSNFYAKQLADAVDKDTNKLAKYIHKVSTGYSVGYYFYRRQHDSGLQSEIENFLDRVSKICQELNIPIIKSGTKDDGFSYIIVYIIVPSAEGIQISEPSSKVPNIPITLSESRKIWKCWRDTDTMEDFVRICVELGFSCEKITMFYWKNRDKFDYLDYDKDETFEEVLKSFQRMIKR